MIKNGKVVKRKKFKLRASAELSGGAQQKLVVKIPKRAAKKVKKALKRKPTKLKLELVATDTAGNSSKPARFKAKLHKRR
jgi:chemotaxis receptor (MCP) glutamine deamidase CheD